MVVMVVTREIRAGSEIRDDHENILIHDVLVRRRGLHEETFYTVGVVSSKIFVRTVIRRCKASACNKSKPLQLFVLSFATHACNT